MASITHASTITTPPFYFDENWKLSKKEGSSRSSRNSSTTTATPLMKDSTTQQSQRKCAFARKCEQAEESQERVRDAEEWQEESQKSNGGASAILSNAFDRYRGIIFKHGGFGFGAGFGLVRKLRERLVSVSSFDIDRLKIIVHSDNEDLQLGVDESYNLQISNSRETSIVGEAIIEANTVYGALRGLETFSQLCSFDYTTKTVQIHKAPWSIQDKPRFAYRGLMLDTSRHYLPIDVIKQIIESMSYAKFNVLHWHIIDEQSFPLEIPTYPELWKGSYTKWERYTVEDAYEIVNFAKVRGINVMAEVDVPGHAESWGAGYPDLWPSHSCREPLDVSKQFTFDVISGILAG
ncbi:hypothetical protein RIF29_14143 [Crotalaria pallida]|uniref:beta-N-acetylhexosaminidase n=1 Tax=Crotalaria pallida TaxID=3830 RepID=A0AAN9IBB9_CROPI